jgi:hypothetical protein
VSKETISRITDKVMEEMADWANRPLDGVYAAVFIDAIVVKVRNGQVGNRPIYAAIGVSLAGEKDVLGLWAGTGGEGAPNSKQFWLAVLTDLKNDPNVICSPWGWRDRPAGHPRRSGQDLCKRVAFEVQMQTCPAGAVAGLASASGSSARLSAEMRFRRGRPHEGGVGRRRRPHGPRSGSASRRSA